MYASNAPVVSVCIPAYNDAAVIGDALRSAMRQEYAGLEILILDNNSMDETGAIVTGIAAGDIRVRYVRNPENIGMAKNFNACIALARGEYVQILCSDDVLEPGCVSLLAATLGKHPNAVLAACGRIFTDQELRPQGVLRARLRREEVVPSALVRECFIHGNRIGEPTAVMFRRSSAGRGFNADYSQALDLEMWFHLLGQGSAVLLPEALCSIRQHGEQITQANIRSGRIVEDKRLLFRQYAADLEPWLVMWEKLVWDARMASSVTRTKGYGGTVNGADISEVFYPTPFLYFLLPLMAFARKLRVALTLQRL